MAELPTTSGPLIFLEGPDDFISLNHLCSIHFNSEKKQLTLTLVNNEIITIPIDHPDFQLSKLTDKISDAENLGANKSVFIIPLETT